MIVTSAILFGITGGLIALAALAIALREYLFRITAEAENELLHEDLAELRKTHRRDDKGRFVKTPLAERDPIMREMTQRAA